MSESAMDEKAIFAADAVWHERIKAAPDWPTTQALMLTRHAWWSALMEWDDEEKKWKMIPGLL